MTKSTSWIKIPAVSCVFKYREDSFKCTNFCPPLMLQLRMRGSYRLVCPRWVWSWKNEWKIYPATGITFAGILVWRAAWWETTWRCSFSLNITTIFEGKTHTGIFYRWSFSGIFLSFLRYSSSSLKIETKLLSLT